MLLEMKVKVLTMWRGEESCEQQAAGSSWAQQPGKYRPAGGTPVAAAAVAMLAEAPCQLFSALLNAAQCYAWPRCQVNPHRLVLSHLWVYAT